MCLYVYHCLVNPFHETVLRQNWPVFALAKTNLVHVVSYNTQSVHATRRRRSTCQLPVTIDAQFVEFVHTQSLELRVWRGDRADWPDGGTACGVAKVVLRSLLTTLGGVGGDVTISPETVGGVGGGSGGDRAGSMTVRLFFKHRGLGSSNDGAAAAEEYARQPMESANRNEEEKELAAAAEPRHGEGRSNARRRAPVSFREGFDVFCEEQTGGPGGGGGGGGVDDPATPHEGPETATAMSNQGSLSAAEESPQQPRGAWEEEEGALKRNSQKRPPASSVSSLGVESGLRVHVERAMRLGVVASAAAALGDRDVGVGGSVSSPPAALLPSTYVTFRWEEEGKPPLRSPLLLPPMPSAPSVGERVGASQEENRQVGEILFVIVFCTPIVGDVYCLPGGETSRMLSFRAVSDADRHHLVRGDRTRRRCSFDAAFCSTRTCFVTCCFFVMQMACYAQGV